jgi:hypothetical protein
LRAKRPHFYDKEVGFLFLLDTILIKKGFLMTKPSFIERRSGLKDRRKVPTFIFNDRRCGISERRKRARFKTYKTLSEEDLRRIEKGVKS